MKKHLLTAAYFLFLFCYGFTIGKCMILDEDLELSKKHSLISGYDFSNYKEKAAITVGMRTKLGYESGHPYLVFEYLEGDKILLKGVDLKASKNDSTKADNKLRSHEEVLGNFVRHKENNIIVNGKYKKIRTFIVTKEAAKKGLTWAETSTPTLVMLGSVKNAYCDDKKGHYNCCGYVDKVLEYAGIDLGRNIFPMTPNDIKELVQNYSSFSYKVSLHYFRDFRDLLKDAEKKENMKKAADIASWNKTLVVGLGATGLIGLAYSASYGLITPYLSSLGWM
ncbi:MAG: hypothetical protein H0X26_07425 [Alphaproteobacteria bacterium]|nr:hypothetical protein [Alphaproteobacteria bacterium]